MPQYACPSTVFWLDLSFTAVKHSITIIDAPFFDKQTTVDDHDDDDGDNLATIPH